MLLQISFFTNRLTRQLCFFACNLFAHAQAIDIWIPSSLTNTQICNCTQTLPNSHARLCLSGCLSRESDIIVCLSHMASECTFQGAGLGISIETAKRPGVKEGRKRWAGGVRRGQWTWEDVFRHAGSGWSSAFRQTSRAQRLGNTATFVSWRWKRKVKREWLFWKGLCVHLCLCAPEQPWGELFSQSPGIILILGEGWPLAVRHTHQLDDHCLWGTDLQVLVDCVYMCMCPCCPRNVHPCRFFFSCFLFFFNLTFVLLQSLLVISSFWSDKMLKTFLRVHFSWIVISV